MVFSLFLPPPTTPTAGEPRAGVVAPTLCTARGREIIRGQGRNLRAESSRYADALKVVFDSGSQRDATTAAEFLAGLGLPNISTGDFGLFNPAEAGYCPELTAAERAAAVQERLAAVLPLSGLRDRLASLQRALGAGVAPSLQDISDSVSATHGAWVGGTYVAGAWIEAMLLQYGAGLPIAYGRITPAQLYELLELHVYYRAVNDRPFAVEQRGGSNLLAHALADLRGGGGGASLYVGHDTNLDQFGVLCDLAWDDIAPYPANATPPGSMLRLTASDACANFPLGGGLCERVVSADFPVHDLRDHRRRDARGARHLRRRGEDDAAPPLRGEGGGGDRREVRPDEGGGAARGAS